MCGDGVAPLGTARLVHIYVHTSIQRFVKYRLGGCGEAVGFFFVCFIGVELFI